MPCAIEVYGQPCPNEESVTLEDGRQLCWVHNREYVASQEYETASMAPPETTLLRRRGRPRRTDSPLNRR